MQPLLLPMRLPFGGVPRSFAVLRVALTATSTAWLVLRLPASSSGRLVGFASQRTLSTIATAAVVSVSSDGAMRAAELRMLDVHGVVDFVKNELKIDPDDSEKLAAQKIDGAALLEASFDELRSYGLSGGAAHAIMRCIMRCIAPPTVELTIFPPTDKKKNNPYKMALTPDLFQRTFRWPSSLRHLMIHVKTCCMTRAGCAMCALLRAESSGTSAPLKRGALRH